MATAVSSARQLVRGRELAWAYATVVVVVAVVLVLVPHRVHDHVVQQASTNLYNLRRHPLTVLAASAFLVSSWTGLWQVPLLVWGYGAVQRWLGAWSAVVVGVIGHVGATLFVGVLLATGIQRGALSEDLLEASDVGFSYGLAAVAGVLLARVPRRWVHVYAAVLLVYLVGALLLHHTYTDLGHLTAFGLGASLALLISQARKRPLLRHGA